MPQLQYDYDYYEHKNVQVNKAKKSGSAIKNSRSTSRLTAVSDEVWKNHRASIRAALDSDEEVYVRRAPTKKIEIKQETKEVPSSVTRPKHTKKLIHKKHAKRTNNASSKKNTKKMQKPKEMSLKKAEVMVSPNVKAEKKSNTLRNIMISLCGFSILFLICYRSSVINESFKNVNQLKAELENVKTVNAQIESEIQTHTDLSNIETYAKYQLGMQKPKESQIRKVVIQKSDKIATPLVEEKTEEVSFWEKVKSDISHIID